MFKQLARHLDSKGLAPGEIDAVLLFCLGHDIKKISDLRFTTQSNSKNLLYCAQEKLGVDSRVQLILYCIWFLFPAFREVEYVPRSVLTLLDESMDALPVSTPQVRIDLPVGKK